MILYIVAKKIFTSYALLFPQLCIIVSSPLYYLDVSYQALRDHCGIKAVIFDKDNTLTAPYENSLHPRAKFGLQSALDVFGRDNVAILSNSAGTDDDPGFVDGKEIEEALGIAVIKHSEKKPGEVHKNHSIHQSPHIHFYLVLQNCCVYLRYLDAFICFTSSSIPCTATLNKL